MTDLQRLTFARWAVNEDALLAARVMEPGRHRRESRIVGEAGKGFWAIQNDPTVPFDPSPWDFSFDPCFPQSGFTQMSAGENFVRAMARALVSGDREALARLTPAFQQLGVAEGYRLPGNIPEFDAQAPAGHVAEHDDDRR